MRPGYNLDYYLRCRVPKDNPLDYITGGGGAIRSGGDVFSDAATEQLWQNSKLRSMLRLSCPQKPATMSGKTWDTRWSKRCLLDYVMLRGY